MDQTNEVTKCWVYLIILRSSLEEINRSPLSSRTKFRSLRQRKHLHFNSSNYRERVSFIINEILIADLSLFPFRTILANENVSNYVWVLLSFFKSFGMALFWAGVHFGIPCFITDACGRYAGIKTFIGCGFRRPKGCFWFRIGRCLIIHKGLVWLNIQAWSSRAGVNPKAGRKQKLC